MDPIDPTLDSPPAGIDPAAAPANPLTAQSAPGPEPEFGFAPPEYDPADYRWVPVRRKPRSDGWTEEKQRRFIEVLADTGLVGQAAKEVGMTRGSAYRLRRAPYAAAFARAWDVARERAGTLIEDIAFERAIEGVEQEVYDGNGALAGSRTVYNDRLLTFLLGHLKPERYSREARGARAAWHSGGGQTAGAPAGEPAIPSLAGTARHRADEAAAPRELPPPGAPDVSLEVSLEASLDQALRAMEPDLPAPAEELLGPEQLAHDLLCAEIADGKLSHFHTEQRAPKSPERERADAVAAQIERGRLADEKQSRGEKLSEAEFVDMCAYYDPTQAGQKRRKPRNGA